MAFDFTCLADAEGEQQVGQLGRASARAWSRPSARRGRRGRRRAPAPGSRRRRERTGHARRRRVGHAAGQQQAQVLLRREDRARAVVGVGRDDHLGEDLGDLLGRGGVERPVDRDDAAEGADRVAGAAPRA